MGAERQIEVESNTARELGDVVALHDAVAVGDGSIVIPGTLRLCPIAHLVQKRALVLRTGTPIVAGIGGLIVRLQALPGIIVLDSYIIGKVAEVLDRLCPDPEATTHANVLVEEVGALSIHHRVTSSIAGLAVGANSTFISGVSRLRGSMSR